MLTKHKEVAQTLEEYRERKKEREEAESEEAMPSVICIDSNDNLLDIEWRYNSNRLPPFGGLGITTNE